MTATNYNASFNNTTPFTDTASFALAASTELTYTIPGDSSMRYKAVFSYPYNANVYVALNQTAVIATPGTIATSTSVLRPESKYVKGGDVVHFISDSLVSSGSMELFLLP